MASCRRKTLYASTTPRAPHLVEPGGTRRAVLDDAHEGASRRPTAAARSQVPGAASRRAMASAKPRPEALGDAIVVAVDLGTHRRGLAGGRLCGPRPGRPRVQRVAIVPVDLREAVLRGEGPALAVRLEEGAEPRLVDRARGPAPLHGEEEHLLHDSLADDAVVLVETEPHALAVEDLVLEGALIHVAGALRGERLAAAARGRLGGVEGGEPVARDVDDLRRARPRREREEEAADDGELEEAMANDTGRRRLGRRAARGSRGLASTGSTGGGVQR